MPNDYFNHNLNEIPPLTRPLDSHINNIGDEIEAAFDKVNVVWIHGETVDDGDPVVEGGIPAVCKAYVVTLPVVVTLTDGLYFCFTAPYTSCLPVTINVNGLGAKEAVNVDGSVIEAGEIPADAKLCVMYDVNIDKFILVTNTNSDNDGPAVQVLDDGQSVTTKAESITFVNADGSIRVQMVGGVNIGIGIASRPLIAVSGTATATIDEADIRTGGKTIILTLTNSTWVAEGAAFDAQRQPIIDGLTSAQGETLGWNNEVRDKLAVTTVVRTSPTVVTIILSAQSAYDSTAQETVTPTVPVSAVRGAYAAMVATPAFTVDFIVIPFVWSSSQDYWSKTAGLPSTDDYRCSILVDGVTTIDFTDAILNTEFINEYIKEWDDFSIETQGYDGAQPGTIFYFLFIDGDPPNGQNEWEALGYDGRFGKTAVVTWNVP